LELPSFLQYERPVAQALCLNGGKEVKTIRADLSHQNVYRDKILRWGYSPCPPDSIRGYPDQPAGMPNAEPSAFRRNGLDMLNLLPANGLSETRILR